MPSLIKKYLKVLYFCRRPYEAEADTGTAVVPNMRRVSRGPIKKSGALTLTKLCLFSDTPYAICNTLRSGRRHLLG